MKLVRKLTKIANRLDCLGQYVLADKLDSAILALANDDPELTEDQLSDQVENILMVLTQYLQNAGFDTSPEELNEIFSSVAKDNPQNILNPDALAEELYKRRQ